MFSCIVAFVPTPLPPAGSRAMTTPVRSDPHTEPAAPRAATAVRTRPFALPEVRWAAIATGLFVLGLAAQFGGAPTWLCGRCIWAATSPAGGSPHWRACRRFERKPSTSTCS